MERFDHVINGGNDDSKVRGEGGEVRSVSKVIWSIEMWVQFPLEDFEVVSN